MNDELRKAAGTAVDVWDDTGTRHEDVVNAMNDLRKVLANNANAAPDSSLAPLIESLIGEYWGIAYEEGKTGISQGDLANQVLGRIRNALIAWSQRAAPQDQDAKMDEIRKTLKIGMNIGKALREGTNEDTAKDAARWRYIAAHWENGTIRYNRDGSFRGLTMAVRDSYRGAYPDAIALVIDEAMEQKP